MSRFKELRIICPVYNERRTCLLELIREWEPVLNRLVRDWEWVFIDDGSTEPDTVMTLAQLTRTHPRVTCRRIPNRGHGPACLVGYQQCSKDSRWILQIDSDGQCRPEDVQTLWNQRRDGWHQFGVRRRRKDGMVRIGISFAVRVYLWLVTGIWHPDPNCPFRLLWCQNLAPHLGRIPFTLANIALALRVKRDSRFSIIGFRTRRGGRSFHNARAALRALSEFVVFRWSPGGRHTLRNHDQRFPCHATS